MAMLKRRTVLKGLIGGAAVGVALPLLECFLDDSGTAFASGAPLPVRFGAWHWGLGVTPGRWAPAQTGSKYEITPELKPFAKYLDQMNLFSGFDLPLGGKPSFVHYTGTFSVSTGAAPASQTDSAEHPTLDVIISDAIGGGSRFRSLQAAATGVAKDSYSRRSATSINAAETSALGLYRRVFGAGYQDPNSAEFKPDPAVMLDLSVLSAVKDDRARVLKMVGASDRARLDQYFTSLRELENQLNLQLQKPPPAAACKVFDAPPATMPSIEVEAVMNNHRLMAKVMAMALTCNQTKVFSLALTASQSDVYRAGDPRSHHVYTHEEAIDKALGYQPNATYFVERNLNALAELIAIFAAIPEGAGTLLDNSLLFAYSDTGFAKTHAINGIPMMTAGRAGGRLKTGLHIAGTGTPATRTGLTVQQAMGLQVGRWGSEALQTEKAISEVLA
jgi:hypothetical protein